MKQMIEDIRATNLTTISSSISSIVNIFLFFADSFILHSLIGTYNYESIPLVAYTIGIVPGVFLSVAFFEYYYSKGK